MTILNDPVSAPTDAPTAAPTPKQVRRSHMGRTVVKWVTSTDHKTIGYLYLMTAFFWFCMAGAFALVMRAELATPGMQFLSLEQYNQLFTMHGTIMLFLFATPLFERAQLRVVEAAGRFLAIAGDERDGRTLVEHLDRGEDLLGAALQLGGNAGGDGVGHETSPGRLTTARDAHGRRPAAARKRALTAGGDAAAGRADGAGVRTSAR